MRKMASRSDPRLVLRFALASLVAFVLFGMLGIFFISRYARERAERTGAFHSTFAARAVLQPALQGIDLSGPIGADYDRVLAIVRERILSDGRDVQVKVWKPDGTVLFAVDPELVGQRFPEEAEELAEVMDGHVESGISNLEAAENVEERKFADKLLEVYVPLRQSPDGPVVAVAELYQDYAFVQADIDAFMARLAPILVIGLLLLYAAVLPIAVRASRELRRRNERLNELLQLEQQTVAELRDLHVKKDDFVAAASHELRTPLTSIIGYLGTLRQAELGEDPAIRTEFLDASERQTRKLQRLITNLLSTANLEDGARPVTIELVDLSELVAGVVGDLDAASRVRTDVPARSVVATDRGRIAEALTCLLENALKYSPASEPVEVGATVDVDGFRIWVTDRGIGLDPAHHEAVFERFYQVDQSATRRFGGLGLGLHLTRTLVEELGGRIEVGSAAGQGSTFTLAMPMGDMPERAKERATAPAG
jgi:signal transduction histidine kinase